MYFTMTHLPLAIVLHKALLFKIKVVHQALRDTCLFRTKRKYSTNGEQLLDTTMS
jgi:hypothetical protein